MPTQGITHVVRGEDLADNTRAAGPCCNALLGLPHAELPAHATGARRARVDKLSKQNGARTALDVSRRR
jgi:glutamyl/glutaminyl-tRNA synthetase